METLKPAVILSDHTAGLGLIRSFGIAGVPVIAVHYDKADIGRVSKYVKERVLCPHPEDLEEEFIDFLVKCADRFGGGFLVPSSDPTLSAISRHKELLERYYVVGCTEWSITEKFINKRYTYELADAVGVPAPRTTIPKSEEDVERYAQTIEYPCLVKPAKSHLYYSKFGRKMVKAENFDQMLGAYREAAEEGLDLMLHEFIPGDDTLTVNYNSYVWGGEALVEFTAEKLRNGPPVLGSTRVGVSKQVPGVLEPGRRLLKAMGFYGFSCVEFKKDPRDGLYKVMDVNGRHNMSSLLAVHCGMNFPWLHYRHLVYGEVPTASDYREGVYWIDLIRDVGYSVGHRGKESYPIKEYIRPYLGPHVFASFNMKDPLPFIQRCAGLVTTGSFLKIFGLE